MKVNDSGFAKILNNCLFKYYNCLLFHGFWTALYIGVTVHLSGSVLKERTYNMQRVMCTVSFGDLKVKER